MVLVGIQEAAAGNGHAVRGGLRPIWPVVELLATVLAQLLLTPLLLYRLGSGPFAVWVLAQTALLAASTLSLGAGTALLPALAHARSRGDAVGAWTAIGFFVRRTWITSSILIVALALVAPLPGAFGWLPVALATLVWTVASEFDNGFSSALKALDRFDAVAGLEVAGRAAQLTLTWIVVTDGGTALGPIVIAAGSTVFKASCKYAALRRRWPRPDMANAHLAHALPLELSAAGAWLWLGLGGGLAFHAFDRWYIGVSMGASVLAAYAVCSQLAQLPHAVVSAASQTLVPWAARQRGHMANAAVRQRVRKLLLMASLAAVLPSGLLLLLLEPLLGLWISKEFAAEQLPLARGLVLVFLLLSLNVPSYFLQFGFDLLRAQTLLVLVAGAVFVGGCLLLSPGLIGFVAMKGLFAVLSLSLIAHFVWWSAAPR